MPLGNANAALAKRRREKLTGLTGAYHFAPIVQGFAHAVSSTLC